MKKLHLVGFTRDIDGLILSPRKGAKTGGFVVALDDELVASIQDARHRQEHGDDPVEGAPAPPAAPSRPRPTSALSPREIQSRLRAGSTIAEVAAQAGVGEDWVLRFADPILAEQGRVVESAQKLTFAKSRLGPSIEPLAESVQWNLTDRGVRFSDDVFANGWSAYNLHGARWAVRFTYSSRKRRQTAEWEVDLRERSLSARNRLASDLGHVEAGRRRPRLEPVEHGLAEGEAPQPPVVDGRGGLRQAKKAGKAAPRPPGRKGAAKTTPAKGTPAKGTPAKGTPAKGTAPGTRGAGAKRSAVAKRPAMTTRAAAAAKTSAANKAPGRTSPGKVSTARSATGATAAAVPAKKSGREPSPRKARAGKKPSSDAPAVAPATKALAAPEPLPERPSHLARPPSPMNSANKATSLPGRRLSSQFARPGAPAPTARRPAPSAPSRVQAPAAEEPSEAQVPSAPPAPPEPQPEPATPAPVEAAPPSAGPGGRSGGEAPSPTSTDRPAASSVPPPPAAPPPAVPPPAVPPPPAKRGPADASRAKAPAARPATGRAAARVVAPPLPRPVPLQGNGDDERPAVVILSTPPSAPGPAAATGHARIDASRAGESGREPKAGAGGVPRDPGTARPPRRRG